MKTETRTNMKCENSVNMTDTNLIHLLFEEDFRNSRYQKVIPWSESLIVLSSLVL